MPRGGVPVGYEVAQALRLPFDIYLKIRVPGHGELYYGRDCVGRRAHFE
ncbi:MAG: hypothetical protein U0Y68_01615 [Blastocatellia bacterium]